MTSGEDRRVNSIWVVVGVSAVAAFFWVFWGTASICDDAYISYRYLENWISGNGLVFNPGERVEGYTNFLWIVALAPFRFLGVSPETASLTLSVIFSVALVIAIFLTGRVLAGEKRTGWVAVALLCSSVPVAYWAGSGMETVMFAAWIAMANCRIAIQGRHDVWSSVLFGLAALTRPTGLVFAVVALGAALAVSRIRGDRQMSGLLAPTLVFFSFPVGHLIFRLIYYGAPLPNTYYAKLTGDLPALVPDGIQYFVGYLASGGAVLAVLALGAVGSLSIRRWVTISLLAQALIHVVYVIKVGGDHFPYHRFLVPIVPHLAVVGALGLETIFRKLSVRVRWVAPVAVIFLVAFQLAWGLRSSQARSASVLEEVRFEREQVAQWVAEEFGADSMLAINAAGIIPYRTGLHTIDMLGLNDRHIARAPVGEANSTRSFAGHFKHDGAYVCDRRPDVVLTSGARLHAGRNPAEAAAQAALNTFQGDREFLSAEECVGKYSLVVEEIEPNQYLVAYVVGSTASPIEPRSTPETAEDWFHEGVGLMQQAKLNEAETAFRRSLDLNPKHATTLTNLAFCISDLGRYGEAVPLFEEALRINPTGIDALYGLALANKNLGHGEVAVQLLRRYIDSTPETIWKQRAREHLYLMTGERR